MVAGSCGGLVVGGAGSGGAPSARSDGGQLKMGRNEAKQMFLSAIKLLNMWILHSAARFGYIS